jgi:hypothetical protein
MGIDSFTERGFINGGIPRFSEPPQNFIENLCFPTLQLVGLDLLHKQARFRTRRSRNRAQVVDSGKPLKSEIAEEEKKLRNSNQSYPFASFLFSLFL